MYEHPYNFLDNISQQRNQHAIILHPAPTFCSCNHSHLNKYYNTLSHIYRNIKSAWWWLLSSLILPIVYYFFIGSMDIVRMHNP